MKIISTSIITCPKCGFQKEETMPTDACQYFYECENCSKVLKPKKGDCCVYCSYGTVNCPPIQQDKSCCNWKYTFNKAMCLQQVPSSRSFLPSCSHQLPSPRSKSSAFSSFRESSIPFSCHTCLTSRTKRRKSGVRLPPSAKYHARPFLQPSTKH